MSKDKTLNDLICGYQTRLQGVANDLAVRLAAIIEKTDPELLKLMTSELTPKESESIVKRIQRLETVLKALEAVRAPAYKAAEDMLYSTSAGVASLATKQVQKEIAVARAELRKARFDATLGKKALDAIIHGQGIQGATIAEWFWRWKSNDLENISRLVRRAAVEDMTVAQIAKAAKGTIKNGYADGIFTTPKIDAQRLARTVVNGVSNNARVETIRQSSDVIDGVKFVGTLDGRTCPHCAAYDGYIWRGEEMSQARRPPIHPNCRCTLVPYVQLRDEEGKPIDLEGERPAANADFDKLAKDAYNAKAKEKGSSLRWDDLSYQTRLKYVYQAQKNFEAKTGKKAFERVPASVSFEDYFQRQPEAFKRSWLGEKRYAAYASAVANGEDKAELLKIFQPSLGYMQTVKKMSGWAKGYDDAIEAEKKAEKQAEKLLKQQASEAASAPKPASTPDENKSEKVYVPIVPDFHGFELNKLDVASKILATFEKEQLEELLDEANESMEKELSDVKDYKPTHDEFGAADDYNLAVAAWQKNQEDVKEYYLAVIDVISKALSSLSQSEPEPKSEPAPTSTDVASYEPIKPDFKGVDPDHIDKWGDSLSGMSKEQLNDLLKEANKAGEEQLKEVQAKKPDIDLFEDMDLYKQIKKKWNKNYDEVDDYYESIVICISNKISELIKLEQTEKQKADKEAESGEKQKATQDSDSTVKIKADKETKSSHKSDERTMKAKDAKYELIEPYHVTTTGIFIEAADVYDLPFLLLSETPRELRASTKELKKSRDIFLEMLAKREPRREDYTSEEKHQTQMAWYEENVSRVNNFYRVLEEGFNKGFKELPEYIQSYTRLPIIWSTEYGDITEEPNSDRKIYIDDLKNEQLTRLKDQFDSARAACLASIKDNEPQREDFYREESFEEIHREWQKNEDECNERFNRWKKELDAALLFEERRRSVVKDGFPASSEEVMKLKVVRKLDDKGAELVKDENGNLFVRKRGTNVDQLRNECQVDEFYRSAGVKTPEFHLYKGDELVKLSRYVDDAVSLKEWWKKASEKERAAMRAQLRKSFAIDVIVGNTDVADRIVVDKQGTAWRAENGGAMAYDAEGKRKPDDQWSEKGFVDDLWIMTGNGARIGLDGKSTISEYCLEKNSDVLTVANEIMKLRASWEKGKESPLDVLSDRNRAAVAKRLEEVRQLADRGNGFIENGYTRDFTLSIIDESYKFSKDGLREACSFKCKLEEGKYGWFREKDSVKYGKYELTDGLNKLLKENFKDAMIKIGSKDKVATELAIKSAFRWKPKLEEAAKGGSESAKYYLNVLENMRQAFDEGRYMDVYSFPIDRDVFEPPTPPIRPLLQKQFKKMSDYLADRMGEDAVDFIEHCNYAQGKGSFNGVLKHDEDDLRGTEYANTCWTKILRLRAQGYDVRDYDSFRDLYNKATDAGYYLGIPDLNPDVDADTLIISTQDDYDIDPKPVRHYLYIRDAFNMFKSGRLAQDYDRRYSEMIRYNAALQIALENSDFTGNDRSKRCVTLMRTENEDLLTTDKPGEKTRHLTGVNESHSVINTVSVNGGELTMIDVPYSRINGFYMMKPRDPGQKDMYMDDQENEFSVDSHGLPIYYIGSIKGGSGGLIGPHVSQFMDDFIAAKKADAEKNKKANGGD